MDKIVDGQMLLDKMEWTKWYGQNGTDKILRIKSSINLAPIHNTIFLSVPLTLTPLASSCAYHLHVFVTFGY